MNIAIRTDASLEIGTGHVMRCLTLAQELRGNGTRAVFVCREHPGNLCEMIAAQGFEVIRLELGRESERNHEVAPRLPHASWLGADQKTDASQTIAALQGGATWDWIIVDHYALDSSWETDIRKVCAKIMVIDDLADRMHACDLLLDQNFFHEPEKRYADLLPECCLTLFGPEYALLRPEFQQARKFCRMRGNGIARVLVYFGGADPDNLTGMVLEALRRQELAHLLVDAVVGPNNPHLSNLEKQAQARPGTRLHIQPTSFVELMVRADLCIGAGGTTTWERLCLGLPSLVISTAHNQIAVSEELSNLNLIRYLGHKYGVSVNDIFHGIVDLSDCYSSEMSLFFDKIHIDGYGSQKVSNNLLEK